MDSYIGASPPRDGRDWDCQCARCGSSMQRMSCSDCEDGFVDHDCGEDCCCCADPEPNVVCGTCGGECGWWECLSGYGWCMAHPRPGREQVEPGTPEWYPLEPPAEARVDNL
jgi:hypothetical protein